MESKIGFMDVSEASSTGTEDNPYLSLGKSPGLVN